MSQDSANNTTRPTKKQHETLSYISSFIKDHGYSPSYREIMRGCNYTSVATVALHVDNLIKRGHLRKRNHSARSLEVVSDKAAQDLSHSGAEPHHLPHIVKEIEHRFTKLEKEVNEELLNELFVLVGALKVLGHHVEAKEFAHRLASLNT